MTTIIPEAITAMKNLEGGSPDADGLFHPKQLKGDRSGVITIAHGHVMRDCDGWMKNGINKSQADALYLLDIYEHCKFIESDIKAKVAMTPCQYSAFSMAAYNLGARFFAKPGNSITQLMREGKPKDAILRLHVYCSNGVSYLDGLFYRRLVEICIGLGMGPKTKPDNCFEAAPIIQDIGKSAGEAKGRVIWEFFVAHHAKKLCSYCKDPNNRLIVKQFS